MRPCTLTVFCFGVASGLVALAPAAAMALGGPDDIRPPEQAPASAPAPASASAPASVSPAAPPAPDKTSGDTGRESAPPVGPSVVAAAPAARDEEADLSVSGTLHPAGPSARGKGEAAGAAVRETFDYAVTVTNHGPSDARQVTVTDRLPASLDFVSSRDGCTAAGRTVTCGTLDLLPVDRSHTWVITVRLAAGYRGDGSDIVNEAVVGAETSDPDPANNKTSLTGLDIPPSARVADLSLAKTALLAAGRKTVRPGEKFVYLITVHNHGPATARTVQVSDLLPPSLTLLSSPDDCAVPKGEDRLVACPPRDRLEPGAKAEFRITVKVKDERADEDGADRGGGSGRKCLPIDNIARVTSATFDPDLSDNSNRPGTNGPGGGPLCLETGKADHHGGKPDHRPDGHGHDAGREEGRESGHGQGNGHEHGNGNEHGRGHGHEHGDGDGDGDGKDHGGHLADSGSAVPAWLVQAPGGLVAGGAALRAAAARRRRPRSGGGPDEETENAPA
ncbi:DUF11 domain-containing protein [Streptomyces sp. NPDC059918]|uniref:DUF11 domain-containing protein n=1 Tax=unclassified Streptomyces TaxID=2593676 RepID=UPI003665F5CD